MLVTKLTDHKFYSREVKSRLKSGNVCKSFVLQFAIQKYKDKDILTYNFACCTVWVCNLVAKIEGGT